MVDLQRIILEDVEYQNLLNAKARVYDNVSYYGVIPMSGEVRLSIHRNADMLLEKIDMLIDGRLRHLTNLIENENKNRNYLTSY
jgi:hypothetical protein